MTSARQFDTEISAHQALDYINLSTTLRSHATITTQADDALITTNFTGSHKLRHYYQSRSE